MNVQVTVTRTDQGATTQVKLAGSEMRKDYASWDDALADAQQLKLVNVVEATAAKIMPPGMPFHTSTDVDNVNFAAAGFTSEKLPPPT
jgi:hypothetical protein